MKVFRVYDDDWQDIFGIKQLKEFATEQVLNCSDIQNIADSFYDKRTQNLVNKIIEKNYKIKTMKEVNIILNLRDYEIDTIIVY